MAYTGTGYMPTIGGRMYATARFNDQSAADAFGKVLGSSGAQRLQAGQFFTGEKGTRYKTVAGIDPNQPGWGNMVDPDYELIGYQNPEMYTGRQRQMYGDKPKTPGFAILRQRSQPTAAADAQQATAQQAAQPLYGKQYSYTDPGDKGYFGMADYRELQAQGASRADLIRYAFSSPKGVGPKVAEQLGIRAYDAPTPSSLSYTDPGDKGFFGMKDFEELSRQGATLQQIKDYAGKAKYGVGGEAASILGIRAATEGDFTRAQGDKLAADLKNEEIQREKAAALQRELAIKSQATAAANLARAGQTPNLQIQPASGTPRTAGTQAFRRIRGGSMGPILSGISSVLNI